jgi:hypothetical protein
MDAREPKSFDRATDDRLSVDGVALASDLQMARLCGRDDRPGRQAAVPPVSQPSCMNPMLHAPPWNVSSNSPSSIARGPPRFHRSFSV